MDDSVGRARRHLGHAASEAEVLALAAEFEAVREETKRRPPTTNGGLVTSKLPPRSGFSGTGHEVGCSCGRCCRG